MGKRIAIIGAGLAGLKLASMLKDDWEVVVFEKSRGVGGRMATRYKDSWEFNHGVPFFGVKSLEFAEFVNQMVEEGVVERWNMRMVGGLNMDLCEVGDDYFVGVGKMNVIGKFLVRGIDVKLETRVVKVEKLLNLWNLVDEKGVEYGGFDWVVTAVPPVQALEVLPRCIYENLLKKVEMLPNFSVMVGFQDRLKVDWNVMCLNNGKIERVVVNCGGLGLVVLMESGWSMKNLDMDRDDMARDVLKELEVMLKMKLEVKIVMVHRWLYAQGGMNLENLVDFDERVASCGDWSVDGTVEGAFLSAMRLVKLI